MKVTKETVIDFLKAEAEASRKSTVYLQNLITEIAETSAEEVFATGTTKEEVFAFLKAEKEASRKSTEIYQYLTEVITEKLSAES